MHILCLIVACFAVFSAVEVAAKDHISSSGKLTDVEFHRMVACAAAPGKTCQRAMIHWPKRSLTVGIVEVDERIDVQRQAILNQALQHAITEINNAGADIKLVFSRQKVPDIRVYLTSGRQVNKHALAQNLANKIGSRPAGLTRIFFENYKITKALVIIAAEARKTELTSVMLEEITQSLGLPTDVRNRHYRRRSIFAESSNRTVRLQGQDLAVLRLHYPPR